jgi:hypothetical protein
MLALSELLDSTSAFCEWTKAFNILIAPFYMLDKPLLLFATAIAFDYIPFWLLSRTGYLKMLFFGPPKSNMRLLPALE